MNHVYLGIYILQPICLFFIYSRTIFLTIYPFEHMYFCFPVYRLLKFNDLVKTVKNDLGS